jgi:plasmid stabilization system protein ParE
VHHVSRKARLDLDGIWDYIVTETGGEDLAERQIDAIANDFTSLRATQRLGAPETMTSILAHAASLLKITLSSMTWTATKYAYYVWHTAVVISPRCSDDSQPLLSKSTSPPARAVELVAVEFGVPGDDRGDRHAGGGNAEQLLSLRRVQETLRETNPTGTRSGGVCRGREVFRRQRTVFDDPSALFLFIPMVLPRGGISLPVVNSTPGRGLALTQVEHRAGQDQWLANSPAVAMLSAARGRKGVDARIDHVVCRAHGPFRRAGARGTW